MHTRTYTHILPLSKSSSSETEVSAKRKGDIGDRVGIIFLPLKYRSSDKDARGSSIGVGIVDKTRKDLFSAGDLEI
jgi:hypothetical protein